MKNYKIYFKLFIVIVTLSFIVVCSCLRKKEINIRKNIFEGEIVFKDTIYDFGIDKNADTLHKCRFMFVNTGKVPISILSTKTSCDCTTASFKSEIINPGDTGHINVRHKTCKDFAGEYMESIIVRINSERNYKLTIRGIVE